MLIMILPGLTARDKDDNCFDNLLKSTGWDKKKTPEEQNPSEIEITQSKTSSLIYKGEKQGILAGKILSNFYYPKLIISSTDLRALQTGDKVIEGLFNGCYSSESFKQLRLLETESFNSRDWGAISYLDIPTAYLKFYNNNKLSSVQKKIVNRARIKPEDVGVERKQNFVKRIRQAMLQYRTTFDNDGVTVLIADKEVLKVLLHDRAKATPLFQSKKCSASMPMILDLNEYKPYLEQFTYLEK